jgi:hypothetical protein
MGGALVWSPFYGKLNTFNQIMYFDFILGIGGTRVEDSNNRKQTSKNDPKLIIETHPALLIEASFLLYLTRSINVRIDLVTNTYWAQMLSTNNTNEKWYTHYDLNFALGFIL